MYELTVKGEFAASHSLRDYEGKCKKLHGHTWHVEVVVCGEKVNKVGMLVDFKEIKNHLKDLLETLDHNHLNDLPYFSAVGGSASGGKKINPVRKKTAKNKLKLSNGVNPTSENIAKYIFDCLKKKLCTVSIKKVIVWESEKSGATYYEASK